MQKNGKVVVVVFLLCLLDFTLFIHITGAAEVEFTYRAAQHINDLDKVIKKHLNPKYSCIEYIEQRLK